MDFLLLAQQCAPDVHTDTMRRIVHVESSYNPYAIGVVGGRLERQPRNRDDAIATARWLQRNGYNFSVGYAQVNKYNFAKYGLTLETAFEPCANLRAGSAILKDCFLRANKIRRDEQAALRDAFSCYYSGNFITGYKQGYVLKIVNAGTVSTALPKAVPGIASIAPLKKKEGIEKLTGRGTHTDVPAEPVSTQSALLF